MHVETIETPSLGDRTYLVHDGADALVVDPQRDTDRITDAAARLGVRIAAVAETHLHNDYVTGGVHLARQLGVDYLLNAADEVDFERCPVTDGEELEVGQLKVRVVATPGHTHTHLSYVVSHAGETGRPQQAVFSGGSLLFGSVGRTDLVSPDDTDGLTHDQFHSVRALVAVAEDDAGLYPTHGFGSFCSSGPASGADSSTMGEQRTSNHALTTADEDRFVTDLIAGLTDHPTYYAHMGPANAHGPTAPDLTVPAPLHADELRARLADGGWVVDLRTQRAFADGHLAGTLSFEPGGSFLTYLGWTLPWGAPLTLLGSEDDVAAAIRELARIGWDDPQAVLGDPLAALPGHPVHSYRRVGWPEVLAETPALVLDVRGTDEFAAAHLPDAVNVPLHELPARVGQIRAGQVWVHCGSGYRAGVAASILDRAGRNTVHVDAAFAEAADSGLTITTDPQR